MMGCIRRDQAAKTDFKTSGPRSSSSNCQLVISDKDSTSFFKFVRLVYSQYMRIEFRLSLLSYLSI